MSRVLRSRWARRGLALLVGGAGVAGVGLLLSRRLGSPGGGPAHDVRDGGGDRWARPGMSVTFRAELMPSRERGERTFQVTELLPSGRVLLEGAGGEHAENEFEAAR